MAQSNPNLTDIFTDIANAIRAKTGKSELISPLDFANEISNIKGGGTTRKSMVPLASSQSPTN